MIIPGIVFFPFITFLVITLFGKRMGGRGASRLSVGVMFYTMFLSWLSYWYFSLDNEIKFVYYPITWLCFGFYELDWEFVFDPLSSMMFVVVTTVSFWVHYYSSEYMNADPHQARFFSYLSLFTFFMLLLVSATNLIQLFVGWEGVGLCSFLLINFWFTRYQANKSAIKAMLVNRFGDIALLFAIVLLLSVTHTVSFYELNVVRGILLEHHILLFNTFKITYADMTSFCFLIAAVGKSAQMGLHTWLPDAMEGPTPVSALIHAATMVTAGVFLLLRTSFVLELSPSVKTLICVVGALTALFGATVGAFQNDIKKVVAYSTCSQLGYMVFACGIGAYHVAMFHLFNHAFFKALLFLSAGSVIHGFADEQDMRKMGGLHKIMPFTYLCFLLGSLSLMGLPFLTGFYSKDFIIELSAAGGIFNFYYLCLVTAAFFTAYYSGRLILMVFLSEPRGSRVLYECAHEPGKRMSRPLFMLLISAIFFGYYHKDMFIGAGTDFWRGSLCFDSSLVNASFLSEVTLGGLSKNFPFIVSVIGLLVAYLVFSRKEALTPNYIWISTFFTKKWYWDVIYNVFLAFPVYKGFYYLPFKSVDKGFLEIVGPFGVVSVLERLSHSIKRFNTGHIFDYLIYIVIAFGTLTFFAFYGIVILSGDYIDLVILFSFSFCAFTLVGRDQTFIQNLL